MKGIKRSVLRDNGYNVMTCNYKTNEATRRTTYNCICDVTIVCGLTGDCVELFCAS